MKLRLALLVMALLVALAGADSATAVSTGPETAAAAKKCKRPKARHNGRCVRRCPAGYVKKRNARWGRKCVRRQQTGNPAPTPNPTPEPAPAPAPTQLTRDDAAGQAKLGEDLLLERASFGSSGQTGEYQRLIFGTSGQFQLSIRDWNTVSGEIPRSCNQGTYAFKEAYTYSEQGGGVVVIVTITSPEGSGNQGLIFHNAEPNYVYVVVNNDAVAFERNPHMTQSC